MFYAITINGNVITGVHESAAPITETTFAQNPSMSAHLVIPIPDPMQYSAGKDIRCYNEDGTLKPLVWCIEQGYTEMPQGHEIINGELVPKNIPDAEAPPTLMGTLQDTQTKATDAMDKLSEMDAVMEELVALLIAQGVITSV